MILIYSFSIIYRLILELIFKNTSSKWLNRISTLFNCTLKKTATLSLLTGIPSSNTQLWMPSLVQMLWRILPPSTTLVSILKFCPYPVSSPKHSFKYKMIDCMFLSCHVRISEWIHTLYLPECQGTPCSKQVWYLKFNAYVIGQEHTVKCTIQISTHNTAWSFGQFGQMRECSFMN